MKKIKEKIETISKFPLKESYIWKGKPSIVTSIIAWLLWFCRLCLRQNCVCYSSSSLNAHFYIFFN